MNESDYKHKDYIIASIVVICFFIFAIGLGTIAGWIIGDDNNSPVGDMRETEAIIRSNDSIKIVVNNLDSIKNAKIIEVKSLDNDSTLRLFYKLVKE